MTHKALGKGLSALLRDPEAPQAALAEEAVATSVAVKLEELPIDLIDTSPYQPRARFEAHGLEGLAQSMRSGGVVQPVIVRRMGGRYELVAGERRLRAAKLAGMGRVPAVVRVLSDEQALEFSLVENLQREDLNPLEQARAFERLVSEFGLTQEAIAERTGKDRATVANLLRLLRLPADIQALLEEGKLNAGHARALLRLEDSPVLQKVLGKRMASRHISVRQAEEMVERRMPGASKTKPARQLDPNAQAAQEAMERALGTRVRIVELKSKRGRVEIDYFSVEDLDRIYYIIISCEAKST